MISSALLLLLAAGPMMVSQVFSRPVRPVLLVVFDGINDEFMSKMPALDNDGEVGQFIARPGVLKSENITKPFPLLHTVATGVLPNSHGVINNTMFNLEGKQIFNVQEQFAFNKDLKPIWTEALLNDIPTATLMWPGANFEVEGKTPAVAESYRPGVTWDSHIPKIKKWFADDGIKFGMAYFEDTDPKEPVDDYIKRAYGAILNLYKELKGLDVDIIIMSSHGKKEIMKSNVLNMDNYVKQSECNCKIITAAGVSFIRFRKLDKLQATYDKLKTLNDYGTTFKVYRKYEDEMKEWNLWKSVYLKNNIFVTAINGHAFYDQKKYNDIIQSNNIDRVREDGYIKKDTDMDSILLLIGTSFKNNVVAKKAEIQIREVYQLIKKLLGLNEPASTKQRVKNLSDNMKKLIENDTLAAWEKK